MEDQLILVDENDKEVGVSGKLKSHQDGLLHRAFSIFVFNSRGELLLQRRALSKYHSAGLWSNTCCGHPRVGERVGDAARLRLKAEMGLDCLLEVVGSFIYRAAVGGGLTEHEFDYLLIGHSDIGPTLNPEEVVASRWVPLAALVAELRDHPHDFTVWFRLIMDAHLHKFPFAR